MGSGTMSDDDYSSEEESEHSDDDLDARKRRELGKYLLKAKDLFDSLYSECPEQMGKQLSRIDPFLRSPCAARRGEVRERNSGF